MSSYIVGFIFARGGSKGIPGKNIRLLAGKPLIAYAIEVALASKLINRVVVSTDSEKIAAISRKMGAEIPFLRPPELARDDTPEWLAWQHAIRALHEGKNKSTMDIFVSVPPTAPLRQTQDVDSCIRALIGSDADMVITVKPSERNPYFNMVILNEAGHARLVIPPKKFIHQRQAAPAVYDMTTVAYAGRPDFILNAGSIFEGKVRAVIVPPDRALDIDSELDFKIAECLLNKLK